jgi:alkylation response protein AidB-like acyl-CoA dehydrogenase
MDFDLSEEQRILVDTLRDMGKREDFRSLAAEIDRTAKLPKHLVGKYAEMGLLGMTLSPEFGGGGPYSSRTSARSRSLIALAPTSKRAASYPACARVR